MRISRVYLPQTLLPHTTIVLEATVAHYITRVLRLRVGAQLTLFNGRGGEYLGRLVSKDRRQAQVEILSHQARECESTIAISLALAVLKSEPMDYALQKVVELGVQEIIPIHTERTVVRADAERSKNRLAHWRAIAIAACQQCGRNRLPQITEISTLAELGGHPAAMKILLDPEGKHQIRQLAAPSGATLVLIGPEGGFSVEERRQCEQRGFVGVGFGPRILRAETASVAVLSALQVLWGEW